MPETWTISLGETAERVGSLCHISRRDQDEFALDSQRKAEAALTNGWFDDELVAVEVSTPTGIEVVCRDEAPRPGLSLESLAQLKPAFVRDGTVTAGSSSGINDGAASLSVVSTEMLHRFGLQPMARIVASAVAGVDPSCMGLGPVPASRKALGRAGLSVSDLDLIELNEAFAVQAIACIRELGLDRDRVNIHGGAIALGHPLGASGARILTTLVHALKRTRGRYGLATMCIGVGQGIAVIVESTG
jgi:acetyl-CoA C-acetyltransferase/3-oxo-5,6-didehydrosuberyl-CoA/3-oxoadipyl-CoA thiolase